MTRSESPFFYNSTLLFSDETMERIATSLVGVVGVGGVGAIAMELLVRLGIERLRVADPDSYEACNLNRQLFATQATLGRNKAAVAAERARAVNPGCSAEVFEEGISLDNVMAFCEGADVLVCQCDRESTKVLLYRAAKRLRIPVVSGARASIHEHRWKVRATVSNYRESPDLPCYDEVFHPEMTAAPFEELTEPMLRRYDEQVRGRDRDVFRAIARDAPEKFGSIAAGDLAHRIETTDRFNKRHVSAVQANTAGCLVATQALKVLIGGPTEDLEIDLWGGG